MDRAWIIAQLFDENRIAISFITELELLPGKKYSRSQYEFLNTTIGKCSLYEYDNFIKKSCIQLRIKYSLKLPDSLIAATSLAHNIPLFTSDKHFAKIKEIVTSIYTF
jgi:predicted nucleic acid-binding protein